MLSDILVRLRSLLCRKTVESELDEELRFHFEHQVEKYAHRGYRATKPYGARGWNSVDWMK